MGSSLIANATQPSRTCALKQPLDTGEAIKTAGTVGPQAKVITETMRRTLEHGDVSADAPAILTIPRAALPSSACSPRS